MRHFFFVLVMYTSGKISFLYILLECLQRRTEPTEPDLYTPTSIMPGRSAGRRPPRRAAQRGRAGKRRNKKKNTVKVVPFFILQIDTSCVAMQTTSPYVFRRQRELLGNVFIQLRTERERFLRNTRALLQGAVNINLRQDDTYFSAAQIPPL